MPDLVSRLGCRPLPPSATRLDELPMSAQPEDTTRYDVVTLGETMLRFTPPGGLRIEQAREFQVHVGGSESNTAVGLARLGNRVTWLSRLPRSPLGEIIRGELERYGVDTSHVVWSDSDRLGLYFLEAASAPRASQVIYDRRDSAMAAMRPDELPLVLFTPGSAKLFHTTGITLAISESARATALTAAQLAKQAGMLVSCDVNYRAKLWSPDEAAVECHALLQQCDLIFIAERDVRGLYVREPGLSPEKVLQAFAARYPQAVCVMTCGRIGSRAQSGNMQWEQGIFASSEIGRLGGGDAFAAGFITHWLSTHGQDCRGALLWGAAASAIKYSLTGDLPLLTRAEVELLVATGGDHELQR
jgi:2-dehydro-3-deoxygluconokinase